MNKLPPLIFIALTLGLMLISAAPAPAAEECCCWAVYMILYYEYTEPCLNAFGEPDLDNCGYCIIHFDWGAGDFECRADDDCPTNPPFKKCYEGVVIEFQSYYFEDCSTCICDLPPLPAGYEIIVMCDDWNCNHGAKTPVSCVCQ